MEENKTNINWYPGHMAKTKKQIMEDLKLVDVIVEILDARIPKASQNPDIAKMAEGKRRVIVLNKSDLAEETETKRWQTFMKAKKHIPVVIVNSNTGERCKTSCSRNRKYYARKIRKGRTKR